MKFLRVVVISVIKVGLQIFFRIEKQGIDKIPTRGPLIIYSNHTGEIEVPIFFIVLQPRMMSGLAKVESWDNPLLGWLFSLFEFIPVKRGEADMIAVRKTLDWLERGNILGISPEGTRNRNGILLKARPGVVTFALKSGVPLLPVAHWGGEHFRKNLKSLKRTRFNINAGDTFVIDTRMEKINKEIRQKIVDEMMYELAALLPVEYRGEYSNLENRSRSYLKKI